LELGRRDRPKEVTETVMAKMKANTPSDGFAVVFIANDPICASSRASEANI